MYIRGLIDGTLLLLGAIILVVIVNSIFPTYIVVSGDINYRPDPSKTYDLDKLIKEGNAAREKLKSTPPRKADMATFIKAGFLRLIFVSAAVNSVAIYFRRKKPVAYLCVMTFPSLSFLLLIMAAISPHI